MRTVRRRTVSALVLLACSGALGAATTRIDLAGKDDRVLKPGNPVIHVGVRASGASADAAALERALAEDLPKLTWMRLASEAASADLDLDVVLSPAEESGPARALPFSARLVDCRGQILWSVTGRTETDGAPIDGAVLRGLGRNVVAALAHDGWLVFRDDPANPPPNPPVVRVGDR